MRILAQPRRLFQLLVGAVIVLVMVLGILLVFFWQQAQAAPKQPVPFPHVRMVQAGITCLFCHPGATKSPAAGIPSVDRCIGCHRIIAIQSPAIQQLSVYWQEQRPIPWVRINQLQRYVHFSHEAHLSASINCERCHGDVGRMEVTRQVYRLNMGFCLDCHGAQPNGEQLKDCVVCHY